VVGAVHEGGAQAHHRVARQNALVNAFAQALFHGGDILARDGTAHDFIHKLEFRAVRHGFKLNPYVPELAVTAGLLLVAALDAYGLTDGLAVGDLGVGDLGFDVELRGQFIDDDVQMQFTLAFDQGLAGIGRLGDAERGVLFLQTGQAAEDLVFLTLLVGEYREGDGGSREVDGVEFLGGVGRGERIPGIGGGKLGQCADIARVDGGKADLVFPHHGGKTVELLGPACRVVQGQVGGIEYAAAELQERNPSDEVIRKRLEDEGREGGFVIPGSLVRRRGQIFRDRVHQPGDIQVLQSGAAEHGYHRAFGYAAFYAIEQFLVGKRAFLEVFLHQLLIRARGVFNEGLSDLLDRILHGSGNRRFGNALGVEKVCLLFEDIHISLKAAVCDGVLQGGDLGTELFLEFVHDLGEIGMLAVHLIDEKSRRDTVFFAQGISFLRTHGDSVDGIDENQRAFHNPEGGVHLTHHVEITGNV